VFQDEPCSEREAWVWLIEDASYKPRTRTVNEREVRLNRGELVASTRFLANAWRWSEARVRRFLKRLQKHGMIAVESSRHETRIQLVKYGHYQGVGPDAANDAPSDARKPAENCEKTWSADAPTDAPTDANENEGSRKKGDKREPAHARAMYLPDDWQPKLKHYELGRQLGFTTQQVDYEATKFCDHFASAGGQNARKRNWDQAFNNWLRRAAERGQRPPAGQQAQGYRRGAGSTVAAVRDLLSGDGG
jgi:hypothetical protein